MDHSPTHTSVPVVEWLDDRQRSDVECREAYVKEIAAVDTTRSIQPGPLCARVYKSDSGGESRPVTSACWDELRTSDALTIRFFDLTTDTPKLGEPIAIFPLDCGSRTRSRRPISMLDKATFGGTYHAKGHRRQRRSLSGAISDFYDSRKEVVSILESIRTDWPDDDEGEPSIDAEVDLFFVPATRTDRSERVKTFLIPTSQPVTTSSPTSDPPTSYPPTSNSPATSTIRPSAPSPSSHHNRTISSDVYGMGFSPDSTPYAPTLSELDAGEEPGSTESTQRHAPGMSPRDMLVWGTNPGPTSTASAGNGKSASYPHRVLDEWNGPFPSGSETPTVSFVLSPPEEDANTEPDSSVPSETETMQFLAATESDRTSRTHGSSGVLETAMTQLTEFDCASETGPGDRIKSRNMEGGRAEELAGFGSWSKPCSELYE